MSFSSAFLTSQKDVIPGNNLQVRIFELVEAAEAANVTKLNKNLDCYMAGSTIRLV